MEIICSRAVQSETGMVFHRLRKLVNNENGRTDGLGPLQRPSWVEEVLENTSEVVRGRPRVSRKTFVAQKDSFQSRQQD